jgi:small subunit ribosomal protein S8
MVMTDPIADMLTRIRNANTAHKDRIAMPASKVKARIAEILVSEGYLAGSSLEGSGKDRVITITMKYGPNRERTITGITRVSKPGSRVYAGHGEVPRVLGGLGVAILSTSRGLLTDRQARKQGVGGEVIARVW